MNNFNFSGLINVMANTPRAHFRQGITLLFLSLFLLLPITGHTLVQSEYHLAATPHEQDAATSLPYLLAAAGTGEVTGEPESGSLVIPGEEGEQEEKKKCLKVCKKWGEDCIINPRTGARDCRKMCKEFGEECF